MRPARLAVLSALIISCASLDFDGPFAAQVEYGAAEHAGVWSTYGSATQVVVPKIVSRTSQIQCAKGVAFGATFFVDGLPSEEGPETFQVVWQFPKNSTIRGQTEERYLKRLIVTGGRTSKAFVGYELRDPEQLLEGTWWLRVSYAGYVFLELPFELRGCRRDRGHP